MLLHALQTVFRQPRYALLALATSAAVFVFAAWLPNLPLIVQVMGHPGVSLSRKVDLPVALVGSIATNFTPLSAAYTIAIALLFGMNVAMLAYFLRRRVGEVRRTGAAMGLLGMASGVAGMGCAACGSFLLTSAFSLAGASGALVLLPLKGGEFGVAGVILLAISLYLTARHIQHPAVCTI